MTKTWSFRSASVRLVGHLTIPEECAGLVVFAHGSGSSRHSPRNRFVAAALNSAGLGTLLFDLLTPEEEFDRAAVFDIELLAERLGGSPSGSRHSPKRRDCVSATSAPAPGPAPPCGQPPSPIHRSPQSSPGADVPTLPVRSSTKVRAPTLLIVGGHDEVVLELNRQAQTQLHCESQLAVVPGATHLFEEPGALEEVSRLGG